tara:strand:+ start:281 stop:610 length:330 start_codon:yes stop_codon:yes gene_type:complete
MAEILREILDVEVGDRPRKVLILERLVELAVEGREWAVKLVMAYTDGLPTVRVANESFSSPVQDLSRLTDQELRTALALAEKAAPATLALPNTSPTGKRLALSPSHVSD